MDHLETHMHTLECWLVAKRQFVDGYTQRKRSWQHAVQWQKRIQYMYMCVHMYIYIYTHIYIHIHIYLSRQVHIYVEVILK